MNMYMELNLAWLKQNNRRKAKVKLQFDVMVHNEQFDELVNQIAPLDFYTVSQQFLDDLVCRAAATSNMSKSMLRAKDVFSFKECCPHNPPIWCP